MSAQPYTAPTQTDITSQSNMSNDDDKPAFSDAETALLGGFDFSSRSFANPSISLAISSSTKGLDRSQQDPNSQRRNVPHRRSTKAANSGTSRILLTQTNFLHLTPEFEGLNTPPFIPKSHTFSPRQNSRPKTASKKAAPDPEQHPRPQTSLSGTARPTTRTPRVVAESPLPTQREQLLINKSPSVQLWREMYSRMQKHSKAEPLPTHMNQAHSRTVRSLHNPTRVYESSAFTQDDSFTRNPPQVANNQRCNICLGVWLCACFFRIRNHVKCKMSPGNTF
jgi:hypothetical protein